MNVSIRECVVDIIAENLHRLLTVENPEHYTIAKDWADDIFDALEIESTDQDKERLDKAPGTFQEKLSFLDPDKLKDSLNCYEKQELAESEPPNKKYKVNVLWGIYPEEVDIDPHEYIFNTKAEVDAFCMALEEHDGWVVSELVYD